MGAGTGTRCFGYKGGIGTSSRATGEWTVGVLVQTNFGGKLRIDGAAFPPDFCNDGIAAPATPAHDTQCDKMMPGPGRS